VGGLLAGWKRFDDGLGILAVGKEGFQGLDGSCISSLFYDEGNADECDFDFSEDQMEFSTLKIIS
jgi:hypothetical protein